MRVGPWCVPLVLGLPAFLACLPETLAHAAAPAAVQTPRPLDHQRLISQARTALDAHQSPCAQKEASRKKQRSRKARRTARPCLDDPVVAVVHPETERIELIRAGREFSVTRSAVIQTGNANGVNTEYAPVYPQGLTVLAVKRPVQERKHGWRNVIYTPYSPSLNVPEVRDLGLQYISGVVEQARRKLRERGVKSRAFAGALVADTTPDGMAVALAINEHMDPNRFTRGEAARALTDEVLTVLGTNAQGSYRYAVSSEGARGLWQFMPGTYDSLRRQYPRARLHPDFFRGTEDHLNAALACLLLLDADLAVLPTTERRRLQADPDELGRFLAATYNGGAGAVEAAFDTTTPFWVHALQAEETQIYVEKFEAIRRTLTGMGRAFTAARLPVPLKG